jgi:hypothetical protein
LYFFRLWILQLLYFFCLWILQLLYFFPLRILQLLYSSLLGYYNCCISSLLGYYNCCILPFWDITIVVLFHFTVPCIASTVYQYVRNLEKTKVTALYRPIVLQQCL